MLGSGLLNYHDTYGHFPPGTVPNPGFPPDKRLSWYVEAWGFVGDGQIRLLIDRAAEWDYHVNIVPKCELRYERNKWRVEDLGEWGTWLCPSNPSRSGPDMPAFTHYIGIAGIGPDAALLPADDARAGVFGYDRGTRREEITDGISTTLLLIETATENGPWTAGGRPTVRGLDREGLAYSGRQAQFSSFHREGVTNALFVDCSVRGLRPDLSPAVFEGMATIAGHEDVSQVCKE
jgi:hypothetical protein